MGVIVASIAGLAELSNKEAKDEKGKKYTPGDCGFDPLGLMPSDKEGMLDMQTKEIKHGRIAMMAVLGYVVQEALYRSPVTEKYPFSSSPSYNALIATCIIIDNYMQPIISCSDGSLFFCYLSAHLLGAMTKHPVAC